VYGIDGGLDLVRPGLVQPQALADDGLAPGDQRAIPECPVLLGEADELALRAGTRQSDYARIDTSGQAGPLPAQLVACTWTVGQPLEPSGWGRLTLRAADCPLRQ
jgi:hypothetical protein